MKKGSRHDRYGYTTESRRSFSDAARDVPGCKTLSGMFYKPANQIHNMPILQREDKDQFGQTRLCQKTVCLEEIPCLSCIVGGRISLYLVGIFQGQGIASGRPISIDVKPLDNGAVFPSFSSIPAAFFDGGSGSAFVFPQPGKLDQVPTRYHDHTFISVAKTR
jgi:hypothetical protein